jgi:hypothetical protein
MLSDIVELAVIDAAFANRALSMAIRGYAGLLHNAKQGAFGPRRSNDFGILVAYGISSIFWSFIALETAGKTQLPLAPVNVDSVCSCRL